MKVTHRRVGTALAIAAFVLCTNAIVPAGADASGCTAAPGGTAAQNCISVWGSGTYVRQTRSLYSVGAGGAFLTVCSPTASWDFKPAGNSIYVTRVQSASSCGYSLAYIDWFPGFSMANHSSLCARQKNARTNYVYTPAACEAIFN